MKNDTINLSEQSIEEIATLCALVKRKCARNETSRTMADGIAEYAERYGFVSELQAKWLCRNCDRWQVDRPLELVDVSTKTDMNEVLDTKSRSPQFDSVERDEILKYLRRIESIISEAD